MSNTMKTGERLGVLVRTRSPSSAVPVLACLAIAGVMLSACAGGPSQSTQPTGGGADFTLGVVPEMFVGKAAGGQRVLLLVTVSGAPADGPVDITAAADRATVSVEPAKLTPGVVGEVTVVPAAVTKDVDLGVTVTAKRGSVEHQASRTLHLWSAEDSLKEAAAAHLARFVPWLAANRPALGITATTTWEGAPGSWVLVVSHYQYLSKDWELELSWHEMIPPYDWVRINLRHRWTETQPSAAFEVSSATAGGDPKEITPEAAVWR